MESPRNSTIYNFVIIAKRGQIYKRTIGAARLFFINGKYTH